MSKGKEMEGRTQVFPLGEETITAAAKFQQRREGRTQRLRLKRSVYFHTEPISVKHTFHPG